MTPEQVLSSPPRVLSQAQREHYFEQGYVLVRDVIAREWVERLQAATAELVERSRVLRDSDTVFDLEADHAPEAPRLRRVTNPSVEHETFWEYVSQSVLADVVADLVGANVKFLDTMLNFKWAGGGEEIKWHQDIPFFPHTNYGVLTAGTLIEDVGPEQAPLTVIPGTHKGELFDLYDDEGVWTGHISERDLARLPLDNVVRLTGPAGTVHIHNCRTIHSSARNNSALGRPLLLGTYAAADAFAYVPYPAPSKYYNRIVRGKPARWAHTDPRPCLIPPDWSRGEGYQSIFTWQQMEAGGAPEAVE